MTKDCRRRTWGSCPGPGPAGRAALGPPSAAGRPAAGAGGPRCSPAASRSKGRTSAVWPRRAAPVAVARPCPGSPQVVVLQSSGAPRSTGGGARARRPGAARGPRSRRGRARSRRRRGPRARVPTASVRTPNALRPSSARSRLARSSSARWASAEDHARRVGSSSRRLGGASGGGVLELDGDPDVAAELLGQRLGEHPAHARLEHGLGEFVGGRQNGGVLDQPQRAGQVQHRVLLRGQARRQPLADLVPDRRQVQRGIGHAASSSPCCRPLAAPVPPARPPAIRPTSRLWTRRTGSTPVSTGCARPAWVAAGLAHRPARRPVYCRSARSRAARTGVRRSVDRPGRPARRDPDVRRGATATLTAPSTGRQRSGALMIRWAGAAAGAGGAARSATRGEPSCPIAGSGGA